MKLMHATKCIQHPIKMHVLYMAKHQFELCCRGSKLEDGYVPGNLPRDEIDGFEKSIIFIFQIRIYFFAFLLSPSIF